MGLLDEFSSFVKTPEGQGLLSAAFGGLATARRGEPINSMGKAGLAGLMGYGQAQDRIEKNASLDIQKQLHQMQLYEAKRKIATNEILGKALSDSMTADTGSGTDGSSSVTPPGLSPSSAAMFGTPHLATPDVAPQAKKPTGSYADILINAALQAGDMDAYKEGQKLKIEEKKLGPKYSTKFDTVMVGGVPTLVQISDDGSWKPAGSNISPAEKLHFVGNGQREAIGINQFTGKVESQGVQRFQTPESIASNNVAMRGQNMADKREAQKINTPSYDSTTGSWIYKPTQDNPQGASVPVPGIDKKKQMTESQSRDNLFGSRANKAHEIITNLEGKYSRAGIASKETVGDIWGVGGILGSTGNLMLSDSSQNAEQAQRDFVNAVLRKESGAVISPQEFDNARKQYFPQVGDSDSVVEQKRQNRILSIEGIVAGAGSAGSKINVYKDGGKKVATMADIQETARKSGKSTAEVTAAMKAQGYTIGGN